MRAASRSAVLAPLRAAPRCAALTLLLTVALVWSGCGSDSGADEAGANRVVASRPAPPKSAFPAPAGRSLREILNQIDGRAEVIIDPQALVFNRGLSRYPFGLSSLAHNPIGDGEVALYIAKSKGNMAQALDEPAIGPFPARIESLATKPAFEANSTRDDPDAAKAVYVSDVDFPSEGQWRIAALVNQDGEMRGTLLASAAVGEYVRVPQRGSVAPRIHTPTAAKAGGDTSKVTTRIPPGTLNEVDYADVLGKKPIALLFATPEFCQSRICGPVVDVAEQVKQRYGDRVAFIHMEIFNDNDPDQGPRSQVRAFNLPTEPWLFAIDRRGIVRATIEGAFGVKALERAVRQAVNNES